MDLAAPGPPRVCTDECKRGISGALRIAPDALLSSSMQGVKPEVPADTTIEIRLADGTTIRVGSDVTAAALRRVLGVLRG
jgi:hypothetical protein